jgi:hypothetical protein
MLLVDALYRHDAVLGVSRISRQTLQYLRKLPTRYSPLSLAPFYVALRTRGRLRCLGRGFQSRRARVEPQEEDA